MIITPALRVESDYGQYFENLVSSWIERKRNEGSDFKHQVVRITAGPYRPDAVTTREEGDVLHLDFYSALRAGFGGLSAEDITAIVEML